MPFGLSEKTVAQISGVFARYPQIETAILYGSRAKGNHKPGSDIDLTLTGAELTLARLHQISIELDDLLLPYTIDLSIHHQISNPDFLDHIARVGVLFYARDDGGAEPTSSLPVERDPEARIGEWQELKLGDVINLKRGYDLPKRLRKDGDIPIFSSSGISGFHDEAKAEAPGVVTGRYGTIGRIFLAETAFWPHNTTLYVEDFKGNDERFVYYFLQHLNWEQFNDKSAVPGVNRNDAHQEDVRLPSLSEQRAIAAVLTSLDDKIDLLQRQNKTLEALAQTLFRHWFVDGAEDDWEEMPLTDFIDFREGPGIRNWQYVEDEDGINFINIRLIQNGDINVETANKISREEAFGKYAHFLLCERDMVISTSGTLGRTAIVRSYHLPLCLNTSVIRFRPSDGVHYSFLYQYLMSEDFLSQLTSMASGSVQLNFGPTHLKRITMLVPPEAVLDAFEDVADPLYQRLNANFYQIRTLEKLRDTLLPKLMSGEVRVRL